MRPILTHQLHNYDFFALFQLLHSDAVTDTEENGMNKGLWAVAQRLLQTGMFLDFSVGCHFLRDRGVKLDNMCAGR